MIEQISAPSASSEAAAQELPRRDYLLLPLIGLATLTLMLARERLQHLRGYRHG
jgi:hypothetical protein